MPTDAFAALERHVSSMIVLTNMYQARIERILEPRHLHVFHRNIDAHLRARPPTNETEFRIVVMKAVFDSAPELQLQGPPCNQQPATVVTFKSLEGLTRVVGEMTDDPGANGLRVKVSQTWDVITEEECVEIAGSINALGPDRDDLHLGVKVPGGRRCIAWFTRTEECPDLTKGPNSTLATHIRNWLGLAHIDDGRPLFAFVSNASLFEPPQGLLRTLARPTIFDGIDMAWFKHRRCNSYEPPDGWGRTVDLVGVAKHPVEIRDGGPEAVLGSVAIPGNFRCLYIGRVRDTINEPDESFVEFLKGGRTTRAILTDLDNDFPI